MPGRNLAGTANPEDYNLGRGIVYFASLDSNDLPSGGFRDLGNAAEFNVNVETEKLEHQSTRTGLKTIDKEVVVSQKIGLAVTFDELNFQNMALFFSGSSAAESNSVAATGITGSGNLTVVNQGEWYDLYEDASGMPTSDIQGKRIYDIGTVTIAAAGGTAMVENTDFTVDLVMGRIFVINGGDMVAGDYDVDIAANASAAANVEVVKALTSSQVEGALKFISENPANSDAKTEYQFHKVSLAAEGDFSLIGDDWTTMQLTGTAEKNETADPDSPYCTVTSHENA